jgi:hypothetical protein
MYPPPPQRWVLPKDVYTPWPTRVWAFLIDWIPLILVLVVPWMGFIITDAADRYCNPATSRCPSHTSDVWAMMLSLGILAGAVYFFWNLCYRQGKTGQSIGKSALKFRCISDKTWQPIGTWLSLVRQIAHHLDQTICYVGYLFPIWDDKRQTLADKLMSTVCVPVNWTAPPAPVNLGYPPQQPPAAAAYDSAGALDRGWPQPAGSARSAQSSAAIQAVISASLVLPTLPFYFMAFWISDVWWESWVWVMILDVYFVVVVAVRSRTSARRRVAVALAAVATLVDRGLAAAIDLDVLPAAETWLFRASYVSILIFVAAWGVARRRQSRWLLGLVPTVGLVVLALWYYATVTNNQTGDWLTFWAVDLGVLLSGCLLCWACDGRRRNGSDERPEDNAFQRDCP